MTVNFEHTEYFEPLHPHASAMCKYSVYADVTKALDEDNEEVVSVTLASIRYKLCSLLSECEWETLDIPVLGNNRETNKMLTLFADLAVQKYESEQIERRNKTA
jgi:hypothetical protein